MGRTRNAETKAKQAAQTETDRIFAALRTSLGDVTNKMPHPKKQAEPRNITISGSGELELDGRWTEQKNFQETVDFLRSDEYWGDVIRGHEYSSKVYGIETYCGWVYLYRNALHGDDQRWVIRDEGNEVHFENPS